MNLSFTVDTAKERLLHICGDSDRIHALIENDENSWTLGFEGDAACLIEWIDEPPGLLLSIDIGTPSDRRESVVFRSVLSYNLLRRETGGATVGRSADTGELVLMRELPAELVASDEFAGVVVHFMHIAQWWSTYVASEDDAAAVLPSNFNDFPNLA